MKKGIKIICVILLVLAFMGNIAKTIVGSSYYNDSFVEQIKRANRDCPIPVANGAGQVSAIKLETLNNAPGKCLSYYIDYKPCNFSKELFSADPETTKALLFLSLCCTNAQRNMGNILIKELIKRNLNLKVIINNNSNNGITVVLTPEYLNEITASSNTTPSDALYEGLKLLLKMQKKSFPIRADQGIVLTDMTLEGNNIVCYATCDESIYDIEAIGMTSNDIALTLVKEGHTDDEICALLDLCKVSHTGLVYRYFGVQSGKKADVEISSDLIRKYHKTPSQVSIY